MRDPIPPGRVANGASLADRVEHYLRRVVVDAESGCWLWQGGRNVYGYAEVSIRYQKRRVHLVVYEVLVGPIPDGHDLHHRCPNRHCIYPRHLEPLTHGQHAYLHFASLFTAANERRRAATHCKHNHLLSGDNLYIRPDGRRSCRRCRANAVVRYERRRRCVRAT